MCTARDSDLGQTRQSRHPLLLQARQFYEQDPVLLDVWLSASGACELGLDADELPHDEPHDLHVSLSFHHALVRRPVEAILVLEQKAMVVLETRQVVLGQEPYRLDEDEVEEVVTLLQMVHKKRAILLRLPAEEILPRLPAEEISPPFAHFEAEAVKVPPRVVVATLVVVLF